MNTNGTAQFTRNESALTWVESLVVIAIIAFLVFILGGLGHNGRPTAIKVVDRSNLRQIGTAMHNYAEINDDRLPVHPRDITDYTLPEDVFVSPYFIASDTVIDRGDFDGPATRYGSYVFINLGRSLDDIENPSELILAYTARADPEQPIRNVLFADGRVESWKEKQLRAALPDEVDVDALDGP